MTSDKIKKLLADHLGIEIDEINNDDTLSEDLHMGAGDLTDFSEKLRGIGVGIDPTKIVTVADLLELADEDLV